MDVLDTESMKKNEHQNKKNIIKNSNFEKKKNYFQEYMSKKNTILTRQRYFIKRESVKNKKYRQF